MPPPPTWTLGRLIGTGSFGLVYAATFLDAYNNGGTLKEIAVKRAIRANSSSLQKEARILTAFSDCPGIVDCYSGETTTEDDGTSSYNLLLEYASAGTLQDLINKSDGLGLPENDVRAYTRMILQPLATIHARGYVHCDLKPQNILAFPASPSSSHPCYRLKLADFGQAIEPGEKVPSVAPGTVGFMSPEAVEDGEIGTALDIWSVGCIVMIMVTGKYPWTGFHGEIPEHMEEEGKDFVRKCLERDPRKRWTAQMLLKHPYCRVKSSCVCVPRPTLDFKLVLRLSVNLRNYVVRKFMFYIRTLRVRTRLLLTLRMFDLFSHVKNNKSIF